MMYPFMTLNDDTEIVHSEMKPDGKVKVYIETPDEKCCFKHATCWLPDYKWEDIKGYSETEMPYFKQLIRNNAHLIIEFSQEEDVSCKIVCQYCNDKEMHDFNPVTGFEIPCSNNDEGSIITFYIQCRVTY